MAQQAWGRGLEVKGKPGVWGRRHGIGGGDGLAPDLPIYVFFSNRITLLDVVAFVFK